MLTDQEICEIAPAKVNLALHVVGQRPDGYHLIETLVTFADKGDVVTVLKSVQDRFSISGPFADALQGEQDNLVLKARDRLRTALSETGQPAPPVDIRLEKNLPVASGIGGGSADAAATLRALLKFWSATLPPQKLNEISLGLGADVPMCLAGKPAFVCGIGDIVASLENMPSFSAILANPQKPVSTPEIFKRLHKKDNPPLAPHEGISGLDDWLHYLASSRNDLEPSARQLVTEIAEISAMLETSGAAFVRMSGSGATCFGLFKSAAQADAALTELEASRPDWYFLRTNTIAT
jgi:4-diphosphocytidyl-2-C-methyl-D-erythritol kinase